MGFAQGVPARLEGGADALFREPERVGTVHRRRDRHRVQGAVPHPARTQGDHVAHAECGVLHVPLEAGLPAEDRRRIAQLRHALAVGAGGCHSSSRDHCRCQQARCSGSRAGNAQERHRLRGAEERLRAGAASKVRAPFRGGKVQFESLDALAGGERNLDAPRRDLARVRVAVGAVEDVVDVFPVLLRHLLDQVGVGEQFPPHAVGGALVPEVAAIERQPERRIPAPQQPAHQTVAEWQRFVPGGDGRREGEVQLGAWQAGRLRARARRPRRPRGPCQPPASRRRMFAASRSPGR